MALQRFADNFMTFRVQKLCQHFTLPTFSAIHGKKRFFARIFRRSSTSWARPAETFLPTWLALRTVRRQAMLECSYCDISWASRQTGRIAGYPDWFSHGPQGQNSESAHPSYIF